MSDMSVYLANKILNHVLRNIPYTPPTSVWLGLFTSDLGLDSNQSLLWDEVSEASYSRIHIAGSTGINFTESLTGSTTTDAVIVFPTVAEAGGWGIITDVAILDAETGGNVLFHTGITSLEVSVGDTVKVDIGGLGIVLT